MSPPVSIRSILAAILVVTAISGCGRRWVAYAPFRLDPTADRDVTSICTRLVARARSLGYQVHGIDPERGVFHARAFLDYSVIVVGHRSVIRASYFTVRVARSGAVIISASGHHVRGRGRAIHRRLFAELSDFAAELQDALTSRTW
jgi:hypothetical protein